MTDFSNLNPTELLYKLLTDHGETKSMLSQILHNQEVMTERINKRESENEQLQKDLQATDKKLRDEIHSVELTVESHNTTISNLKWAIVAVGTIAAGIGALTGYFI